MKKDLLNTTFIIPLRIESDDRLRNIITVVCFLLDTLYVFRRKCTHWFGLYANKYTYFWFDNVPYIALKCNFKYVICDITHKSAT